MYVVQRWNRGLRAGTGDRQCRRDLAKADGLSLAFAVGQCRGETADEGVARSRGVDRLDLRRLQVLEALAVGKQRALGSQGDDHFTGSGLDQLGRRHLGAFN